MKINHKLFYTFLCFSCFVTAAISIEPVPIISKLAIYEKTIYAEYEVLFSDKESKYFYSQDGGKTWKEVNFEIPNQAKQQLNQDTELPISICLPENPSFCYRTNDKSILESQDGGKTWITSWAIPESREDFYRKTPYSGYLEVSDIEYLELNNKQIIIATAGSQGVLIKTDNNEWVSVGVNNLGPILIQARDFREAENFVEIELLGIFVIFCFLFFINTFLNIEDRNRKDYYLLVIAIYTCMLIAFLQLVGKLGAVILIGSLFLIIIFTPYQLFTNTNKRAKKNSIILIFITLTSCSLLIFWSYGVILLYKPVLWLVFGSYFIHFLWVIYFPAKESLQPTREDALNK